MIFLTEVYWLILSLPHNGHEADILFLPPPPSTHHAPVKVTGVVATSFIMAFVVMTFCSSDIWVYQKHQFYHELIVVLSE